MRASPRNPVPCRSTGIDQANLLSDDASWRPLEERIADGVNPADPFAAFTASGGSLPSGVTLTLLQRVWGLRYIDDLVCAQTETLGSGGSAPPDGDFANAAVRYALTDRLYSVVAMTDAAGQILEKVRYNAYGVPTLLDEAAATAKGDVNREGVTNFADPSAVLGAYGAGLSSPSSAYTPEMDVRGAGSDVSPNGAIDFADQNAVLNSYGQSYTGYRTAGKQSLQTVGNTVGYCGYLFDPATGLSLARFRWYDAGMGRWMSRDPIGYWGGSMSVYEYVDTQPAVYVDPYGLDATWPEGYTPPPGFSAPPGDDWQLTFPKGPRPFEWVNPKTQEKLSPDIPGNLGSHPEPTKLHYDRYYRGTDGKWTKQRLDPQTFQPLDKDLEVIPGSSSVYKYAVLAFVLFGTWERVHAASEVICTGRCKDFFENALHGIRDTQAENDCYLEMLTSGVPGADLMALRFKRDACRLSQPQDLPDSLRQ